MFTEEGSWAPDPALGTYAHGPLTPPAADGAVGAVGRQADWSPAGLGAGVRAPATGQPGFPAMLPSLAAGPFTLRTGCVRRGQLHTLELSFIQLPPFFPPSPFPWLKILSKVENTPEKGPLRAGDCPPPWAALALGRNTQTCPDLSQPGETAEPSLITENTQRKIGFMCQRCRKAGSCALRGPRARESVSPETPIGGERAGLGLAPTQQALEPAVQRQLVQLLKIEVTSSREAGTRAGPEARLSPGRREWGGGQDSRPPPRSSIRSVPVCGWARFPYPA